MNSYKDTLRLSSVDLDQKAVPDVSIDDNSYFEMLKQCQANSVRDSYAKLGIPQESFPGVTACGTVISLRI